jgi:ketosteroid isomerase-like protein
VTWLRTQPALSAAESLHAETARSADLGYTWGSYEASAAAGADPRGGHYARVWARQADGAWRIVLDLDAPRPPRP